MDKFYLKRLLLTNFWKDFLLYVKYSNVLNVDTIDKMEAHIILHYHGLEKGMLFENIKLGFGKYRVGQLHHFLAVPLVEQNLDRSQINVAYQIMCRYYELHQKADHDISAYYTQQQYTRYAALAAEELGDKKAGVRDSTYEEFYANSNERFELFAHSRKSIRNFSGEYIPIARIQAAIELAKTAPSVCNRQATKVHLLEDKSKIDRVLGIQGGFSGFTDKVRQLLIVTNDRQFYYTAGERNQLYIDGGIFVMNLLYGLHYHKIASCPANWCKEHQDEKLLSKIIHIPSSQKIICMIPIGAAPAHFKTTLSHRRGLDEIMNII